MAVTQKDKIIEATILAQRVKYVADRIEFDAKDYDTHWPLEYSKELRDMATEFLELGKPKRKRKTTK